MTSVSSVQAPVGETRVGALGVAGLLATFAFVAVGQAWNGASTDWPTTSLVLAVTAVLTGGIAAVIAMKVLVRTTAVSVGQVWVVYFVLTFGLASLGWWSEPPLSAAKVVPRSVVVGVLVSFVALMAWSLGYLLAPSRPGAGIVHSVRRWVFRPGRSYPRSRNIPVTLYLLGTLARLAALATGRFGYLQDAQANIASPSPWQQAISLLDGLTQLGLVAAALDAAHFSRSKRSRVVLLGLLATELGVGMLSASKQSVLVALLTVGGAYVSASGRVNWHVVLACAAAAVFVFSVNAAYRNELRTGGSGRVSVGTAARTFPRAVSDTFSADPRVMVGEAFGRAASRVRQVDNMALIIERTPSTIPFEPWESLVYSPVVRLIPRAIWPSKPVLTTGLDFSRQYYDLPDRVYTSSAPTTPGDLYRHGGLVPLALGMALLGAFARGLDTHFSPRRDVRHLFVVIPLLVLLSKSETGFVSLVLTLLQTLAFSLVVARLVFTRGVRA